MSLLMKALASAEKEKKDKVQLQQDSITQNSTVELSLSPEQETNTIPADSLTPNTSDALTHKDSQAIGQPLLLAQKKSWGKSLKPISKTHRNQKIAANVFTAAQLPESHFYKVLWLLSFVAVGLIIWLGMALFPYRSEPQPVLAEKNDMTVASTPLVTPTQSNISPATNLNALASVEKISNAQALSSNQEQLGSEKLVENKNKLNQPRKNIRPESQDVSKNQADKSDLTRSSNHEISDQNLSEQNQPLVKSAINPAPQHALNLFSQKSKPSIDPNLLSAYQAFNQGEFSQAQQQYREVLRKDIRNIDALLGMAAIAERQGRHADAVGWYQKILEIEPNQTLATTAILNLQTQTDPTSQISRLKNLITQQPETASLHAALGNAYAEQNDWLSAQAAYFDAARFAPNHADYAFNLAVSLEHIGKPALALLQYQRALALVQQSGATSPDRPVINARIQALQN